MKLSELLRKIDARAIIGSILGIEIEDLCDNSQNAKENSLFFCMDGKKTSGKEFLTEAENKGAVAVITQKELQTNLTQIIVSDVRLALGQVAAAYFGNPQEKLKIVEVVGTNGKTSVVRILQHIFKFNGKSCGIFSTGSIEYCGKKIEQSMTTPNSIAMFKHMADMVKEGCEYLFMEMSAQAIMYKKFFPLKAKVGIFTNCKSEHMEFFENLEQYQKTKQSFFNRDNCEYALINIDDPLSLEILKTSNAANLTFGIEKPSDCFAIDIEKGSFIANIFDQIIEQKHNLVGRFNVYNLLAAMSAAMILGLNSEQIYSAVEVLQEIRGRFDINNFDGKQVIIDYAHTEAALLNVLEAAREITENRLISVFGCGGERDVSKRAKMGKISTELADFTIITSDNPRFEEPTKIMDDIEAGCIGDNYVKIENRTNAIRFAKNFSTSGDTILICGKGDEQYQEVCGIKNAFSDYTLFGE